MEEAVRCGVCSEVYREAHREPLVLPCGHTYCRFCLAAVQQASGRLVCPACRHDCSHCPVHLLPVCYPLLGLSSTFTEVEYELCTSHEEECRYWCELCERELCSLCLYRDHPEGHPVLSLRTACQQKKANVGVGVAELREAVEAHRRQAAHHLTQLTATIRRVSILKQHTEDLTKQAEEAITLKSLVDCEKKVIKLLQEDEDDASDDHERAEEAKVERRVMDDSDEDEQTVTSTTLREEQVTVPTSDSSEGNQCASLSYLDGRLVLHSLPKRLDSYFNLELPCEVFLQLSVLGQCLGRVYIRLWSHLRRAQQFFALCLGSLGPSYRGAFFSHVAYEGNPKETLCCTEYLGRGGRMRGTRELLTDLEWGGQYAAAPRPGLVIPLSKNVDEHGFGICSIGMPGGTFHCPFGEVSSGLEVVRKAIDHNPVTEVIITDCGVVLPKLQL